MWHDVDADLSARGRRSAEGDIEYQVHDPVVKMNVNWQVDGDMPPRLFGSRIMKTTLIRNRPLLRCLNG